MLYNLCFRLSHDLWYAIYNLLLNALILGPWHVLYNVQLMYTVHCTVYTNLHLLWYVLWRNYVSRYSNCPLHSLVNKMPPIYRISVWLAWPLSYRFSLVAWPLYRPCWSLFYAWCIDAEMSATCNPILASIVQCTVYNVQ